MNKFNKNIDYATFSRDIDSIISQHLMQWEVKDSDIINYYTRELSDNIDSISFKTNLNKQIKIYREVKVPSWLSLNICRKMLTYSLHKLNAEIFLNEIKQDKNESKLYLDSGYNGQVLSKLVLVQLIPGVEVHKVKLAVVVDDVGYSKKALKEFFRIKVPLTFAVMPSLKYTSYSVNELTKRGFQVILHLPLEPLNFKESTDGYVLTTKMDNKTIIKRFNDYLNSVGEVKGLNNHMGSVFTENEEKMKVILNEVKKRKLFFFDSVTTHKSVCRKICAKYGISFIDNNAFIDHTSTPEYLRSQLELMAKMALRRGYATGICHVQRKYTAEVLIKMIPELEAQGCEFVFLKDLIKENNKPRKH